MKKVLWILLLVTIVGIIYVCVVFILIPIRFSEEKKERDATVMQRLIEIKEAQIAYYDMYGDYAPNLDTLVKKRFIQDSIRLIPRTNFSIEMGIGTKETTTSEQWVIDQSGERLILDSIHAIWNKSSKVNTPLIPFKIPSMPFVKHQNKVFLEFANSFLSADMKGKQGSFKIERSTRSTSKVIVLQVPYQFYLDGLNRWEIEQLIQKANRAGQYPGLQIKLTNEPIVISDREIDYN